MIMPRNSLLTEFEKGFITASRSRGETIRKIASNLKRSKSAVGSYVKNKDLSVVLKKQVGRPSKCKIRHKRQILRHIKRNPGDASQKIMRCVGLSVSRQTACTILRRLKARYTKRKARPLWKKSHLDAREKFAKKYQTWDLQWRNVLFSDEKKFNLNGPDGYQYYWHALGSNYEHYSKRQGGGQSLMVYGAFAYGGKLPLIKIRGYLKSSSYTQMLQQADLKNSAELIAGDNFYYQHDNATCHTVSKYFI